MTNALSLYLHGLRAMRQTGLRIWIYGIFIFAMNANPNTDVYRTNFLLGAQANWYAIKTMSLRKSKSYVINISTGEIRR